MTITGTDANGKKYIYNMPLLMEIHKELYTPADCLSVSVLLESAPAQLNTVSVDENGETIFEGPVDEQCAEVGDEGAVLKLEARGKAALLLDNEAVPKSFANPYFSDVFRECARPYGITKYTGINLRHTGEFKIEKGMSAWEALESFCRINHRLYPRVGEDGVLRISSVLGTRHHKFGRGLTNDVYCHTACRIIKRYKPVSEIVTRANGTELYQVRHTHALASFQGITRRRIKNYPETTQLQKKEFAQRDMQEEFSGSRILKLRLPGYYVCSPGDGVRFSDPLLGNSADDVLIAVRHILGSSGQFTELECWPRTDLRIV